MITITNGAYTKSLQIGSMKNSILFAIKTLKWIYLFRHKRRRKQQLDAYCYCTHTKRINSWKCKSQFFQMKRRSYRILFLIIEFTRTKKYDKHKAYVFYHHKRWKRVKKGFWERLKEEIFHYIGRNK